jgi:hypothetical protein
MMLLILCAKSSRASGALGRIRASLSGRVFLNILGENMKSARRKNCRFCSLVILRKNFLRQHERRCGFEYPKGASGHIEAFNLQGTRKIEKW